MGLGFRLGFPCLNYEDNASYFKNLQGTSTAAASAGGQSEEVSGV